MRFGRESAPAVRSERTFRGLTNFDAEDETTIASDQKIGFPFGGQSLTGSMSGSGCCTFRDIWIVVQVRTSAGYF